MFKLKKIVSAFVLSCVATISYGEPDPKAAMSSQDDGSSFVFQTHFLGTGSPLPMTSRFGPAIVVQAGDEYLLFDGGRGAIQRLHSLGIPFSKIDKLFITHLHSDHTIGVPDIFLTGWLRGRKTPLNVWGPEGTKGLMDGIYSGFEYDIKIRLEKNKGSDVIVNTITEGVVYENNGLKVTAFEVDHGPVKPALGYRIDYEGKSVLLSGDTRYSENLKQYAKDVDLLVHEVAATSEEMAKKAPFTQNIIDIHTTPEEAGKLFAEVKPQLAVYSHIVLFDISDQELVNKTRTSYSGPLVVASDLMTIGLTKEGGYSIFQTSTYKD